MQSYKKTLRITGVAAALLLAGCQKSLFPGIPRYMREPGGLSRLAGSDQEPNNSKHLYITALDNSQAVLYMDGKETVRSPAEHDPERLRVRDGHLWTDVIQGKETVVFRDGKEWLRFPGEEVLTGFLLREGKVHTLGQRPGNGGICYRVDGKEVFSSDIGRIIGAPLSRNWDHGAFCSDTSGIYYTFAIPFSHSGGTTWEYRVMKGSDTFMVFPDDVSGSVLDIRLFRGKVYRAELSGRTLRFLCGADVLWSRTIPMAERLGNVELVPIGGEMCLKGVFTHSSGYSEAWILMHGKTDIHSAISGKTPHLLRKDNLRITWVEKDGLIQSLTSQGRIIPIPSGRYRLDSPLCLNVFDGALYAALTDTSGLDHLIIADTSINTLRFPGVPTSIRKE